MGLDMDDIIIIDFDAGNQEENRMSESCCIFRKYRMSLQEMLEEAE